MRSPYQSKELQKILATELGGNKARIACLSFIITSLLKVQSVNFNRIATGFYTGVQVASNLRRVQRFFRQFKFIKQSYCNLLVKMLPLKDRYQLSLDRTNWKLGSLNINILFLSVIYQGVGIPIFWVVLGDKRGNSSQEERIDLLIDFSRYIGLEKIDYLTADREFIGDEWLDFLVRNKIRFVIRIRNNMYLKLSDVRKLKAEYFLRSQKANTPYYHPKIVYLNNTLIYFSGIKYIGDKGQIEYLALVTLLKEKLPLELYKQRWQIETMFKAFKSSGFNLESTHINDYERLNTLIQVVSIAFIWAYNVGIYQHKTIKKIEVKKHGRKAKSFFSYGLENLTYAICNHVDILTKKYLSLFLSCT